MRTVFIWIFGLLASAIVGGIIGSRFDADGGNYLLGGMLAGMLAFACIRLWLGEGEN